MYPVNGDGGGSSSGGSTPVIYQSWTLTLNWSLAPGCPNPDYFEVVAWWIPNAWVASHAYASGDVVLNGGNCYQCTGAGTSAGSGGPTGTGSTITDNTCTWSYQGASGANNSAFWLFSPKASPDGTFRTLGVIFQASTTLPAIQAAVRSVYLGGQTGPVTFKAYMKGGTPIV